MHQRARRVGSDFLRGSGSLSAIALAALVGLGLGCDARTNQEGPLVTGGTLQGLQIRGFNFTNEGFRRRGGGYRSPQALASLDRLVATGANTIAIVPYTFMRDPAVPSPLLLPRENDGESDRGIVAITAAARERGLSVMLKPQIWIRRSWPGEVQMDSRAEWATFFQHYRTWILHYARLAEAQGAEFFSVGVELAEASQETEAWRQIISEVRESYSGKLVYSANWYDEYEHIQFWDALDYVGVDFYYPLASAGDASDEALARGAGEAVARLESFAKRTGKPVLITEAGFGSSVAPWVAPHASDERDLTPSAADQTRAYRALTTALDGREWLSGVLFWKWPSHGEPSGSVRASFSPIGTETEDLLTTRWGGQPAPSTDRESSTPPA